MNNIQKFFSITQTSSLFGVNEKTIYRWIKNREFKIVKISGRTYIPKEEIERKTEAKYVNELS